MSRNTPHRLWQSFDRLTHCSLPNGWIQRPTMAPFTETHICAVILSQSYWLQKKGESMGILFFQHSMIFYVLLQVCLRILATVDLDFGAVC